MGPSRCPAKDSRGGLLLCTLAAPSAYLRLVGFGCGRYCVIRLIHQIIFCLLSMERLIVPLLRDPLLQASFQNKWPLRSILLAEAIKKAILVRMACKLGIIMYPNLPANPHARGTISVRPREDFTSDGAGSGGFQITRNSCASPQDLPGFRNLMLLMHAARISEY